MKNIFLSIILIISGMNFIYAQNDQEITILYLLPFQFDEAIPDPYEYKKPYDIYNVQSFQMVGFWQGAKLALQEYDFGDKKVHVIVRDIVDDIPKLYSILNDKELMKDVDLIIGPFFSHVFPTAAAYANRHHISIVNPFSSRFDFLKDNEYVYMLKPKRFSSQKILYDSFIRDKKINVILWGDSSAFNNQAADYIQFFDSLKVPYTKSFVKSNLNSLKNSCSKDNDNLIIALFENDAKVLNQVRLLSGIDYNEDGGNHSDLSFSLVVPESWLDKSLMDLDFYSLPNLYFISTYFVDKERENTVNFEMNFIQNYSSFPDLRSFAYQGYDVTKYFIEYFFNGWKLDNLNPELTASKYVFEKIPNGGYINSIMRLVEIKDLKIVEYQPIR